VIQPGDERARAPSGPGFSDAVTFAWGDPGAQLYGLARVALSGDEGSVLAVLFAERAAVAALARGGIAVPAGADFAELALPGVATRVATPLRAWSVRFEGREGAAFELGFEALTAPVELDPAEPVARLGGMTGYEQLCRVHGSVRAGAGERAVHCLGQRSHAWGEPDWERLGATRTIAAWLDDGTGVTLAAVRAAGAKGHAEEARWGALLDPAGSLHVGEPRLSTTYDADGRQRRAGLELWLGEQDEYPRRAAGEVLCGSTLELGELALDAAVFRWHMDGRAGIGRYDILRRARSAR
jgi:hypothetical protein